MKTVLRTALAIFSIATYSISQGFEASRLYSGDGDDSCAVVSYMPNHVLITNDCGVPIEVQYCYPEQPELELGDIKITCEKEGARTTGIIEKGQSVKAMINVKRAHTSKNYFERALWSSICSMANRKATCGMPSYEYSPNERPKTLFTKTQTEKLEMKSPSRESASSGDPRQVYQSKTQPSQETAYASNSPHNSSSPGACESYIIFPAETVNTGLRGSWRPVINPARFEVNMAVVNNPAELKRRVDAFQKFYSDNDRWDLHHLNVIEDVASENSMYRDLSASSPYRTPEVFTEKHAAEPGKSLMSIKPILDNARCWAGMNASKVTITKSDKKDWSDYPVAKSATSCLQEDKSDSSLYKNICADSIEVYSCNESEDYNSCSAQGRRAWEEWRSDIGVPKGWGIIVNSHRIRPGESFSKEDQVAACPRGATIAVQFSLSHEQQNHRCIMVPGHREED